MCANPVVSPGHKGLASQQAPLGRRRGLGVPEGQGTKLRREAGASGFETGSYGLTGRDGGLTYRSVSTGGIKPIRGSPEAHRFSELGETGAFNKVNVTVTSVTAWSCDDKNL